MDLRRSNWDTENPKNGSNCNESPKTEKNDPIPTNEKSATHKIQLQLLGVAIVLLLVFALVLPLTLILSSVKTTR